MSTLSNGIVNVALPVLTREFEASLVLAQWVVLGYVLCITGLLLPAGRLADMRGRKEVFLACMGGFLAMSVLCGLAGSLEQLILCRIVQGMFGAALAVTLHRGGLLMAVLVRWHPPFTRYDSRSPAL